MTVSRRTLLKLGLGAGAVPLLDRIPLEVVAGPEDPEVKAVEDRLLQARPLPLKSVRLLGGPLKRAQEADMRYLLELEPDRMLAYYRERAGLKPKAEPYGGWDGDGRNLTGHVAGHYLSAVSLMWAATGDARFKERADYIVAELKVVQDKHGDGYLSALEGGRECFDALARGEIRASSFDLNGQWSPWYTLHKTYGGLRDAYRFTGNRTALEVETRFAEWAERILSGLSDAQLQHMMDTEFGGMNEVLVDLYADTGDRRWLELSYKFEHRAFIEPLQRHQDDLAGTHANTQIPKVIGSVDRFAYTGEPADLLAASFFWDRVARHHSFSTGGHGTDEYFGPPDVLGARVHGRTSESCNVYNMLKLSRRLFSLWPDAHYADFHERALFNHALASLDPETGRMCYMVPVGPGVTHEYQDMFRSFTCCVGTGMENHALHGDGIYYEAGDKLWVNLYAPSKAEWSEAGVRLTMATDFPEGETAKLTLDLDAPREFTLAVRRPYWVADGFSVKVNGRVVEQAAQASKASGDRRGQYDWSVPVGDYVEVKRSWRSGDVVEVTLPKSLRLEPTPDDPRRVAIMWGPLVLAGDLGPEPRGRRDRDQEEGGGDGWPVVPVFVAAEKPVETWVKPVPGEPGHFRTDGVGREPDAEGRVHDVDLVPFYRLHRRTYSTYWDLLTPPEWEERKAGYVREAERQRALEAASVGFVQPGDREAEEKYNYQSGDGITRRFVVGRRARAGRSWFSYDLPVDASHPMAVVVTYYTADRRSLPASFEILVDGQRVGEQTIERTDPGRFFDVSYAIPPELVRGKQKVTVRFQAKERNQIAAVFGVRMVRADEVGN
ncbi:MAG TPA: beta-L-arabinofuranosidase domain-containing protein [Longimicrobiales bacterium]